MNKTTLVLQAYGPPELHRQALFAVYSWLHFVSPDRIRVCFFTDASDWLLPRLPDSLEIHCEAMGPERLQKWRGEIDFVHRVKIEALREAAGKFGAPLLYLDGDTACYLSPEPLLNLLAAGQPVMHTFEGKLRTSPHNLHRKIWKRVRNTTFNSPSGPVQLQEETPMWNAGVLGLPAQAVQRLDTVLALTDQLYRLYPKHVMEQLAFSQVLSQVGKLSAADACIHHYWRDKDEWNSRLADFFATHVDYAQAQAQVPTLFRTPVPDAESERRKSWWKRFSF